MAVISTNGRFQRVNRALCELTGYPRDELVGKTFGEITHPDDVDANLDALRDLIEGERYGYRTEKRYIHADGHALWVSLNLSPIYDGEDGAPSYLIAQIEDVSDRKESEERLTRQALHDSLTGLPNRTLFSDRVRMASARRGIRGFAIIYLDLDGFKLVNDTLGHAAGDQVLIEVGRRLERLLRVGDTLARLGGDEFALLCEEVSDEEVRAIADRVIEAMAEPIELQERAITQAASIGIALYSAEGIPIGARPDAGRGRRRHVPGQGGRQVALRAVRELDARGGHRPHRAGGPASGGARSGTRSRSTTSPRSTCEAARSPAPRHWSAGGIRTAACSSRRSSSSSRKPAT